MLQAQQNGDERDQQRKQLVPHAVRAHFPFDLLALGQAELEVAKQFFELGFGDAFELRGRQRQVDTEAAIEARLATGLDPVIAGSFGSGDDDRIAPRVGRCRN